MIGGKHDPFNHRYDERHMNRARADSDPIAAEAVLTILCFPHFPSQQVIPPAWKTF